MPDTLLDDVNALLSKQKGDKRVLEQIKRAVENNEVISIYERNYVAKLREEFLEKKKEPAPWPVRPPAEMDAATRPVQQAPKPAPKARKNGRQTKVIVGAGCAALAAIIVAALAMSEIGTDPPTTVVPTDPDEKPGAVLGAPLSVDERSYALGDIISISGRSDASLGGRVTLSIQDPGDALVWSESISMRPDGTFATLAIAGGPGWGGQGLYELTMEHGDRTESIDFGFDG